MKHDTSYQDQHRPPDEEDGDSDRIHARFDRLMRKVRDESDAAVTKFIRLANHHHTAVSAQSGQGAAPLAVPANPT